MTVTRIVEQRLKRVPQLSRFGLREANAHVAQLALAGRVLDSHDDIFAGCQG